MFGGGNIDVKTLDDRLYIDMYQLTVHLLQAAQDLADTHEEDSRIIAESMAMIAVTLSELALYTLEKDEIDNVDEILKVWSGNS